MSRGLAPADAVVVGGGLVAAAVALELARRDLTVDLLSPGRAGKSAAPGGPVAAQAHVERVPEAFADLALLSRHLFSDWLSALEEETGLPCEYDERGAMTVALDDAEEVLLDRALDAQRSRAVHFEVLEPEDARGREPALAASLRAAFAFPRDGVARAGRVGRALVLAARAAGVRVREGVRVRAVSRGAGRVTGVETSAGFLPSEVVVLAGADGPDGVEGAPRLGLEPSSRVWLRLGAEFDPDRPGRLLVSREVSLVPRRDGTCHAVGRGGREAATAGPASRDIAELLAAIARMVPAAPAWHLRDLGVAVGFTAPDGVPALGETGEGGLLVAAGFGADELLLSPAAAAFLADLVMGRTPPLAAGPFSPGRFGA